MRHLLLAAVLALPAPAFAQATITVDVTADAHPISPFIYGMNYASAAQITAGGVTLTRWGGNSTTRYNYEVDATNTGADYYFENVAGCWSAEANYCAMPPANPKDTSGANAFLASAAQARVATIFTIPTLGWIAKAPKYGHPFDCGSPRTFAAQQDGFDPYDANCGDGKLGGNWIAMPAPTTTSVAIDAAWAQSWVGYLTAKFGPSNGQRIYALDNEPNLWSSTHRDVHPAAPTYDELWQRMRDAAVAILAADPTAVVAGPVEWGWPNYFCSAADDISKGCSPQSPDRAKHGGEDLTSWLLDQAAAWDKANGVRLIHYLDLHYYPQGGNPPAITRSLWDPSYTDPSWIGDTIRLLPRMRDWTAQHYPGTKISLSEYDFYHHDEAVGAITYVEVLGLFGREGLDAATTWSPPAPTDAAFGAWKLFRNYDGAGAGFETTSAQATVMGAGVEAYAASSAKRLTVAIVNENNAARTIALSVAPSFVTAGMAHLYTGDGVTITKQPDVAVQGGTVTATLAPVSFAMLVLDGEGPSPPDMATSVDAAGGVDAAAHLDAASRAPPELGASQCLVEGCMPVATVGCGCALAARPRGAGGGGFAMLLVIAILARRRR